MMLQDVHGHELTGATEEAAADFERGTHELRCFIGDPVASADRAIAAAPDFVMAHALKGYLYGLSTEAGAQPVVETCHAAASRVAASACACLRSAIACCALSVSVSRAVAVEMMSSGVRAITSEADGPLT